MWVLVAYRNGSRGSLVGMLHRRGDQVCMFGDDKPRTWYTKRGAFRYLERIKAYRVGNNPDHARTLAGYKWEVQLLE